MPRRSEVPSFVGVAPGVVDAGDAEAAVQANPTQTTPTLANPTRAKPTLRPRSSAA